MNTLNIYEYDHDNNAYRTISQDGLQTSPIQSSHDGTNGEVVEKKIYIRNDDVSFFYSDIRLTPYPARKTRVGDIQYPEAFVGFKILAQENQPTKNEWLAVESGATTFVPDIGTSEVGDSGYKPLWIQIQIPPGTRAQTISDVGINVQADQNPAGI